jgi:hypothetical protein
LKRNYAWWLFSGRKLTYDKFKRTSKSPVLHHFNDHSTCGSWCKHTKKCEDELKTLKKYRSKETNAGLYLLCSEIIEKFSKEAHLRECHHRMHSQKNEAMNRSIMRYCPKEKTFARTNSLTSRIALSVGIDTLGHAKYYEDLFFEMQFTTTELTFSGLRRMFRKKEYGRMYKGLRSVKVQRRINQRQKMIEGCQKMEMDEKEGRGYSTGVRMRDDEEEDGESRTTKRARKDNNTLTRSSGEECKCGGKDHKRISSSKCPWKGQSREEVTRNYEQRIAARNNASLRCSQTTTSPTGDPTGECEVEVQSTSK